MIVTQLVCNYGPAKKDNEYEIIEHGYNCVLIKCNGKPLWIPGYTQKSHNN